jgi:hypothetical protein
MASSRHVVAASLVDEYTALLPTELQGEAIPNRLRLTMGRDRMALEMNVNGPDDPLKLIESRRTPTSVLDASQRTERCWQAYWMRTRCSRSAGTRRRSAGGLWIRYCRPGAKERYRWTSTLPGQMAPRTGTEQHLVDGRAYVCDARRPRRQASVTTRETSIRGGPSGWSADQARPWAARPRRATASRMTAASNTAPVIMNLMDDSSPNRSIPLAIEKITRIPSSAE